MITNIAILISDKHVCWLFALERQTCELQRGESEGLACRGGLGGVGEIKTEGVERVSGRMRVLRVVDGFR